MKKKILASMLAVSILAFSAGGVMQSQAFNLGSLLKIGGVGFVVDRYGDKVDSFLNKVLKQNNLSTTYATKVVPIISFGQGGYIGAAQVTGPISEIKKVEAVAQVEASFNGTFRLRGLVPVDNMNPTKASRVQGVGVSALIDVHF